MKICTKCRVPKNESEFYTRYKAGGTRRDCKECQLAYQKSYRKKNPEKLAARGRTYREGNRESIHAYQMAYRQEHLEEKAACDKNYSAKNRERIADRKKSYQYGLAPGDFKRMLEGQRGVCAICEGPGGKKGLGIDHDHATGKVRSLLCSKCNAAIGLLNDSSALVLKASEYLAGHGK